jgi:hypothetical protein
MANLRPLPASHVCRLYWMLSSLSVAYSYSVNGVAVSRNFNVSSVVSPRDRLLAPATFYGTKYFPATGTSCMLELRLDVAYFNPSDSSEIGLAMTFEEADSLGLINLCLHQISSMASVSKAFAFAGSNFVAYLNYVPSLVSSVELASFAVGTEFFEI